MIKPQKRNKYKKLEDLFMTMSSDITKKKVSNKYISDKYNKDVVKLTKKLFGMRLNLRIQDSPNNPAYCMPKPVVGSNTLIRTDMKSALKDTTGDEYSSEQAAKILEELEKNPGTIDNSKAMLGGGFSKIPVLMVMDFTVLTNAYFMNGKELFSIFLHELGHIYTWYASAYRINSTNNFMLDVSTHLKSQGDNFDVEKVTHYIKTKADELDLPKEVTEDLDDKASRNIYGLHIARMFGDMAKSDIGSVEIDNLESERLADAFVASCGFGKDLALSVMKVNKRGTQYDKSGKKMRTSLIRTTKWTLTSLVLSLAVIAFMIPVAIVMIIFYIIGLITKAIINAIVYVLSAGSVITDHKEDEVYDELLERITKVYRTSIKLLKSSDLSKQERMDITTDLVFMKEMVDDLKENPVSTSIAEDFSMFLKYPLRSPNVKTKLNEYMNALEDLSANDLYLTSSRLTLL